MNDNDVLGLLIYANELDGRHSPNEAKVYAWQEALEAGARTMTVEFAKDFIRKHYGTTDAMLSPSMLVTAWNKSRRIAAEARLALEGNSAETHCGRGGCMCTHDDPCYKGWIDTDSSTSPCPICRTDLSFVLAKVGAPGNRTEADFSLIRNRQWGDHE